MPPTALPLSRIPRDQVLPLSPDQYRIWFLHQLTPGLIHFNINFAFRVKGPFDIALFAQSLNAVVERHESLRTTFELKRETPEQVIHRQLQLDVPTVDLSALAQDEREHEARRLMEISSQRPFSLATGPLLRSEIYVLAASEVLLLFTIHHIVADFDSLKLITRDLFYFYNLVTDPSITPLEPLPIQQADYAAWQIERLRRGELAKQLEYWKEQLAGELPVLRMPMDRPRPAVMSNRGAVTSITFSRPLTTQLQELSKRCGMTLFVTLYSAYQVLLHRYTGQLEINIGTPITTRSRLELRNVVGLFINTLVLKSDLAGDPTFVELLKRNRKIAYGAFARHEIPYEQLVDELRPQRSLSHNLFFQTMVMLLEPEAYSFAPGLEIERFGLKKRTTTFELTLTFTIADDQLALTLDYNTDLYDEASATTLLRRLDILLQDIVRDPLARIADLSIMSADERAALLARSARRPALAEGLDRCVHTLFSEQARRTPEAVAVRFRGGELSYAELDRRSNQLAHWLLRQGVTRGAAVGLTAHRSLEMLVGMLGIVKAGAAYVPIDPGYPTERIEYMVRNSGAAIVLASDDAELELELAGTRMFSLEPLVQALAAELATPPEVTVSADDLMYVIYTSGSTGEPKGVMVAHRSVVNHCREIAKRFRLSPEDKILQFTSPSFDVSVQEIFPTLLRGATLVLWKDKRLEENGAFLSWTAQQGITILNLTTAHWNSIVADLRQRSLAVPDHLKLVIVGGEKVSSQNWLSWDQLTGGRIRFINDYGLTETTITATMFEPEPGYVPQGAFPVGTPIDNVEVQILDCNGKLVPDGIFGELYIGGLGVAKGYIGRPELTRDRFVENPHGTGILFKTGDRARFKLDGNVEFEGRSDDQVKIRGHRVQLEEIEARISQFEKVAKSVVIARDNDRGSLSLVAYLVPTSRDLSIANLQAWLKQALPEYMLPADFVVIEEIPLTVNGKVDKARLPAPQRVEEANSYVAPRNDLERMIADCWGEVLKRPSIGASSGFFDMGGDSLLATRVIANLKQRTQATIPLKLLFEYPVLADFAAQVEQILAGAEVGADRCLVRIRRSGGKAPLFYVHPVGGSVTCYFSLSRQLGPDQPFLALQSHAMVCKGSTVDTIEKMAMHYLAEIREVQPHGPYRLGGWSMGGLIAYEMARLLAEQGETVAELSMIDSYLTKSRIADEQTILFNFVRQLAVAPGKRLSDEALRAWENQIHSHADLCCQLRATGLVPQETTDDDVQHLLEVYTHTVHAFKLYDPKPSTKLALDKVILFRARDSHEQLGIWSQLVEHVAVHQVDADHFGIVHHPDIGRILSAP
jgi:amino acid adenylation domain-containing protein